MSAELCDWRRGDVQCRYVRYIDEYSYLRCARIDGHAGEHQDNFGDTGHQHDYQPKPSKFERLVAAAGEPETGMLVVPGDGEEPGR